MSAETRTTWPTRSGAGRGAAFLHALVGHEGNECVPWPLSIDTRGYGHFGFKGKLLIASRFMCELTHGPAPSTKHQAAHSCHNRKCVNPNHIAWETPSGNQLGRRGNGTAKTAPFGQGGRVLTPQQIAEARALDGTMTRTSIAEKFGCSRRTIERACTDKPTSFPAAKG